MNGRSMNYTNVRNHYRTAFFAMRNVNTKSHSLVVFKTRPSAMSYISSGMGDLISETFHRMEDISEYRYTFNEGKCAMVEIPVVVSRRYFNGNMNKVYAVRGKGVNEEFVAHPMLSERIKTMGDDVDIECLFERMRNVISMKKTIGNVIVDIHSVKDNRFRLAQK